LLTFQKNVCFTARKQPSVSYAADCDLIVRYGGAKLTDKHLASRIVAVDDEIISWLRRRKGSRANPDNRQGHREADTYRTAKHHHEI
jgi:hypothetical protein